MSDTDLYDAAQVPQYWNVVYVAGCLEHPPAAASHQTTKTKIKIILEIVQSISLSSKCEISLITKI